jgi:heat shock protein HslJ
MTFTRVAAVGFALACMLVSIPPVAAQQVPVQIPGGTSTAMSLTQGPWQWEGSVRADGTSVAPADPTRYTAEFGTTGSLVLQADCNTVLGTYTTSGSSLSIQLGPSSLVGCPPGSLADEFTNDIAAATRYSLSGGQLSIELGTPGARMTFIPLQSAELVGPTWKLLSYNNGRGGVQSVAIGTSPTAAFGADGRISGSGGCNQFNGSYTLSGNNTISIGPLATTRMACAPAIMDQENAYLAALQASTQYAVRAAELTLRDANDATQATFVTGN